MASQYFVAILFLITGTIAIVAAAMNWEWFFHAPNVNWLVKRIGRNSSRIAYACGGMVLLGFSIYLFLH